MEKLNPLNAVNRSDGKTIPMENEYLKYMFDFFFPIQYDIPLTQVADIFSPHNITCLAYISPKTKGSANTEPFDIFSFNNYAVIYSECGDYANPE